MPEPPLCSSCERSLRTVPRRIVADGAVAVDVVAAFAHSGAASQLVRHLKYRRSIDAGRYLARRMARLVPPDATGLVPVPRVMARRISYGIDQTRLLADELSRITGLPVRGVLAANLWSPRSAGRGRVHRPVPSFAAKAYTARPVLVDDVCTTGRTLIGAALALGYARTPAVVATSAGSMG